MYPYVKRATDIILSLAGLILGIPFLLVIAVLIKMDSKGPVLFKQRRVGKDKTYFHILKFRTMKTDTPGDIPTHLLENPDVLTTRVGRILRRTSLDELPQMINILKGEMSIVGPRPALWNQYDLIEQRDKYHVNELVPGLTGWAQVNGRDELEIDVKAKFDGEYTQRRSIAFDIRIFFTTIFSVFRKDGFKEGKSSEKGVV